MAASDLPAKAQQSLGLPQGFKTYSPFPFGGMNLQASPIAVNDQEFIYCENFLRLGDGYLRTAWDRGVSIYTAPPNTTIVYHYFYTIASNYYVAVFLSDGSAVQVNTTTMVNTQIGPPGTFYQAATGTIPACSQWGALYLLISNRNTNNDYWAWDGSILYGAGTAAPNGIVISSGGRGYTSIPTITAYGGYGTNLIVVPTLSGGTIVNLQITNPGSGYQVGDVVQLAFSGGGSDTNAILTSTLYAGTVAGAVITAGGSGYTQATTNVSIFGGGGTGATATAVVTNGVVVSLTITNAGSGYTTAPTIVISGNGIGALAIAKLLSSGVQSGLVVNGGSGFTSVPLITFVGGGGAGATGTVLLTGTTINIINITAGGSGYTSAPTVVFSTTAGGTAAAGTAVIQNGQVVSITITNAGSGYTSVPTITFTGGAGTGAGAVAVLTATSIASVVIDSAGQYYTSAPAIEVSSVSNNAAYATVQFMPFGVSGNSMETFQSRVWIANPAPPQFGNLVPGGNFSFTAGGSFTDFATADGGGFFTSSDSFLQTKYTGIRQSNGYLYFFGDGSVSVVSNVQTAGSPATTTFNYQNVDPQEGLSFRDTRQDFGRSMLFANETGVYGLYGGSVSKVSQKLDQLFNNAIFPPTTNALTPSGGIATLFNVKHYLCLMTVLDPDTSAYRNVMVTWNEKDWVITSQTTTLTYISSQKVESKFQAWGTDGTNLFPLFNQPSSALTKRLDTKLYGSDRMYLMKDFQGLWMQAQDNSVGQAGVNITVSFAVSGLATQQPSDQSVPSGTYSGAEVLQQEPNFNAAPPAWPLYGVGTGGLPFVSIGARLITTSPDFSIGTILMGYNEVAAKF